MAKSKARKPTKSKASVRTGKVLVQVRIPKDEHDILTELCAHYGQTIAHRLHMIIQDELEKCYPLAVVSFDGKSLPTRVIVEKHSIPDKKVWQVRITKDNADGILPKALDFPASLVMPHCSSKTFDIAYGYQDMMDTWHLQLVENPGTQEP